MKKTWEKEIFHLCTKTIGIGSVEQKYRKNQNLGLCSRKTPENQSPREAFNIKCRKRYFPDMEHMPASPDRETLESNVHDVERWHTRLNLFEQKRRSTNKLQNSPYLAGHYIHTCASTTTNLFGQIQAEHVLPLLEQRSLRRVQILRWGTHFLILPPQRRPRRCRSRRPGSFRRHGLLGINSIRQGPPSFTLALTLSLLLFP